MSELWKSAGRFRSDAVIWEQDNESNVLYLFDESHRKDIKKTAVGKSGPDVFHESPKTIVTLAKKKLFAVLDVEKGYDFAGFIAVGSPPTDVELGNVPRRRLESALLSVPSGKLRLETAGSFSLGPDEADENGIYVNVIPGEYLVTLSQINPVGNVPERVDVNEFAPMLMTLTPQQATNVAPGFVPALEPAEPPEPPFAKYTKAYSIQDGEFIGLVSPDGQVVNLNPAALQELGVAFGDALRIEVDGTAVDAYYIGDNLTYQLRRITLPPAIPAKPWFAAVGCADGFGKTPLLSIYDWSYQRWAWPAGKKRAWRKATATRRADLKWQISADQDTRAEVLDDARLRALVLTCTPHSLTLNVDAANLSSIGAVLKERFNQFSVILVAGNEERKMTIYFDSGSWGLARTNLYFELGEHLIAYYRRSKHEFKLDTDDPDQFAAAVGPERIAMMKLQPMLDDIRARGVEAALAGRTFARPLDLVAAPFPHWSDPNRAILHIETLAYARDDKWHSTLYQNPAEHEFTLQPGDEVILRRA